MIDINDLLIPEDSHYTCQYKKKIMGYGAGYETCGDEASIKLPIGDGPNCYCWKHAMETLKTDLSDSKMRSESWEKHGAKSGPGTFGASMAMMNSNSDINTITHIIEVLENYASQQMRKR